jgi:hypothetical protein
MIERVNPVESESAIPCPICYMKYDVTDVFGLSCGH